MTRRAELAEAGELSVFMAFLSCVLENNRSLLPLLALGISAVICWRLTGDLRPYGAIKFGPTLLLAPAVLLAEGRRWIGIVLLFGVGQISGLTEGAVYSRLPLSGHTLKRMIAALATHPMLGWRTP